MRNDRVDMLDCCRPLSDIAQVGLTISEFACLARCNGLRARVVSPLLDCSPGEREAGLERFREELRKVSKGKGAMALSYSRKTLGQTGDGHFSPIGAICEEKDMVLILDVARFKSVPFDRLSLVCKELTGHHRYPSYWVPVSLAYEAMFPLDKATGHPRGYVLLEVPPSEPGSLCAPQTLTTVMLNKVRFLRKLQPVLADNHRLQSSWAVVNSALSRTLLAQSKAKPTLPDFLLSLLSTLAAQPTPALAPRRTEAATQAVPSILDAFAMTNLARLVPQAASAPDPHAVLLNLLFLLAALCPRLPLAALVPPELATELATLREEALALVTGLGDEVLNATKQLAALGECCRSEEGDAAACGCTGSNPKPIAPVE